MFLARLVNTLTVGVLTWMQEMLKQLQSKLEQEAGNLASSGRTDVLHQLKGKTRFPLINGQMPRSPLGPLFISTGRH